TSRSIEYHPVLARKIVRRMARIPYHIDRGRIDRRLNRIVGHIFGGWLTSVGHSLGGVRKHHGCRAVGVIPGKIARASDYLPLPKQRVRGLATTSMVFTNTTQTMTYIH